MKTKIIIAGIGGVGGYFGGLLAKHYYGKEDVEIIFFARGKHLIEIQKKGLTVIKGDSEFIAMPTLATDNPSEIGIADFIIIATKSYDLESIIHQLGPCINQDTIILPLLNGVDSKERIKNILPDNLVLDGCAYIISRLKDVGVIENSGNIQTLYFGLDNFVNDRFLLLENLFKEANIEASLSENISTIIWEKFIFISAIATATSYYNMSIGELISNNENINTIKLLIEEVKQIAKAKEVFIQDDISDRSILKLKSLPFDATSSMHVDFKNKKAMTELESLCGYVVQKGQKYNLETPIFKKIYTELKLSRV